MLLRVTVFHRSQQLGETELEPDAGLCPICDGRDHQPIMVLQDQPRVVLRTCRSCHASSASRLPTLEALEAYYGDYHERERGAAGGAQVTIEGEKRFGAHLARRMLRHGEPRPARLLDFGGGDGTIVIRAAENLLERGFPPPTITVVDYSKGIASARDPRILVTKQRDLEDVGDDLFDLVCASGVIEHIPRPRAVLEALLARVAPGGLFYARTPYMVPLIRLLQRFGRSWDFTFPGHIHDLGQDFWEHFFATSPGARTLELVESHPSLVETGLRRHPLRTLAAYTLKSPWRILGRRWGLVGGWEVFALRADERQR